MSYCPKGIIKFFKACCDEHRHSILELLKKEGELNVSDIVKKIDLSQPTVSHHLKILCEAEIIQSKKKGKEMYYSLVEKHISNCCHNFLAKFCKKKKK